MDFNVSFKFISHVEEMRNFLFVSWHVLIFKRSTNSLRSNENSIAIVEHNLSSINSIIFINAIHILINISSSWFFY